MVAVPVLELTALDVSEKGYWLISALQMSEKVYFIACSDSVSCSIHDVLSCLLVDLLSGPKCFNIVS